MERKNIINNFFYRRDVPMEHSFNLRARNKNKPFTQSTIHLINKSNCNSQFFSYICIAFRFLSYIEDED